VSFDAWVQALEARHLAELTFPEVSRALRALSSTYVERRGLRDGKALGGAGKRAAFALFYGPLHFLIVDHIVRSLPHALAATARTLVDLGCGTGASGAAWAKAHARPPEILALDIHPWALEEAAWTYKQFALAARIRRGDAERVTLPKSPAAILAAFTVNELSDSVRDAVLETLLDRACAGDHVLIVEPVARGAAPWWPEWAKRFEARQGRADEWRFHVELPDIVRKLDRAAGMDHRELTARSLWR
jgi:SAM-dependent methyltransferase